MPALLRALGRLIRATWQASGQIGATDDYIDKLRKMYLFFDPRALSGNGGSRHLQNAHFSGGTWQDHGPSIRNGPYAGLEGAPR